MSLKLLLVCGVKFVIMILNFLAGAAISYLTIRYRLSTSEKGAQINDHIKDIEKFCDLAISYWLATNSDHSIELEKAAKIRIMNGYLARAYADILDYDDCSSEEYKELMLTLFDKATGGAFEGGGSPC